MRAAIFHGPGRPINITTVDTPQPGPSEILVKVHRCGICGSDISMTGNARFAFAPGGFGHEYAGEVVEVGRNVTKVKPGQRIACMPAAPCQVCEGCIATAPHFNPVFCHAPKRPRDGWAGFGEFAAISADAALILPDSLSLADGALVEPMACGLHGLRLAALKPGDRVLVLGAGSMALSIVYWARRLGAGRIVVASRSAHRRDVAGAMGADEFHSFEDDDPATLAAALGGAPDVVAECVGKPGLLARAIDHVRPRGTVISMGMCMHAEPVVSAVWTFKEAKLLFPLAYTTNELIESVRAFDTFGIHPDIMVSDVIALEKLPSMIEDMRAGTRSGLKVHVDPSLGVSE